MRPTLGAIPTEAKRTQEEVPKPALVAMTGDLFGFDEPVPETTPEARLYNMVPDIARRGGREPEDVRRQLGSLRKQFTTEKVINALLQARDAADPLMYARKVLSNAKKRQENQVEDGTQAFLKKG